MILAHHNVKHIIQYLRVLLEHFDHKQNAKRPNYPQTSDPTETSFVQDYP